MIWFKLWATWSMVSVVLGIGYILLDRNNSLPRWPVIVVMVPPLAVNFVAMLILFFRAVWAS